MNEKLKETIKEYLFALPKEMQEVFESFDWANISIEIGRKNGLLEEELNDLQTETALVLLGICNPNDYTKNLENQVSLTKEESRKIANEVEEKIFSPMAEKVKENIKTKITNKKTRWDQNVNFILSGGDYFFFLDKTS